MSRRPADIKVTLDRGPIALDHLPISLYARPVLGEDATLAEALPHFGAAIGLALDDERWVGLRSLPDLGERVVQILADAGVGFEAISEAAGTIYTALAEWMRPVSKQEVDDLVPS